MRWIRLILLTLLLPLVTSCGSRQETADGFDKALNAVTIVVDPLYAGVVVSCDLAEGVIIARHTPDQGAEAAAKMRTLRGTCDGIFASIEGLRSLQRVAREAVDAYRAGEITIADVVVAIGPVTEAVQHIKDAVQAFRETYGSDRIQEPEAPPPTSDIGAWDRYLDRELTS